MGHFLLGIDIGSSSVKVSLLDAEHGKVVAQAQSPADEMGMEAINPGWAEQNPDLWWEHVKAGILLCKEKVRSLFPFIHGIGISYQMHGLVAVGKDHKPLRSSIIWCDSRAVEIGQQAFKTLGKEYCLTHLLNSPGNFTASKLKWVKDHEPSLYESIHKMMLPGDYIALKLTGEMNTTATGLSEGIFWDFEQGKVSEKVMAHFGFHQDLIPAVVPVFGEQGIVRKEVAMELGIPEKIPVAYRAGDQPNNAFSLKVISPGETAATAGTSGVIYHVTGKKPVDMQSRVNTFLHVNHVPERPANGVLLCVNGTGILNSWMKNNFRSEGIHTYEKMNALAAEIPIGAKGLVVIPFGNGAERILENRNLGASVSGLDFNQHQTGHFFRAAQEGIVFALRYGFDVLKEMGLESKVIRAGLANMFLSPVFREAFVNCMGTELELYNTDGATGAARGAGVGTGLFSSFEEAFENFECQKIEKPSAGLSHQYEEAYQHWRVALKRRLEDKI